MRGRSGSGWAIWTGMLIALGCAATPPGCHTAPKLQAPPTLTADRELEAILNADLPRVHEAARRALIEAYPYRIFVDRRDAHEGLIRARTDDDRLVRVEAYYEHPHRTRLQIFVSPMGDEEQERAILAEIERNL
jgi:hypothetical protein